VTGAALRPVLPRLRSRMGSHFTIGRYIPMDIKLPRAWSLQLRHELLLDIEDCWSLHAAGLDNMGCAVRLRRMEQEERRGTSLSWNRMKQETNAILVRQG
jgi:hypothetical protein